MKIKNTEILTKTNIFLYVFFIPANLFEFGMFVWEKYISTNVVSESHARFYFLVDDIESFERLIHDFFNITSLFFLVWWFVRVTKLHRTVNKDFKANKFMVYFFWLIPGYTYVYVYLMQKRIIRNTEKYQRLTSYLNRINNCLFIFFISSFLTYLFRSIISIVYHSSFDHYFVFKVLTPFFGLGLSILYLLFYLNYLKLERKIILDYYSSPVLDENDLIDS